MIRPHGPPCHSIIIRLEIELFVRWFSIVPVFVLATYNIIPSRMKMPVKSTMPINKNMISEVRRSEVPQRLTISDS